jgi:hypothetical protein
MSHRDTDALSPLTARVSPAPADLTEEEKKKSAQAASLQCSPAGNTNCRGGCVSCMRLHRAALKRPYIGDPGRVSRAMQSLQRNFGNHHLQRLISLSGDGAGPEAGPEVEESIQQKRGGGQALDSGVRRQMESSMGADFGGVRVHNDTQSDGLNRALNAKAFTTGQDIFFSAGSYRPGTAGGRELLAHELTHVVQQTGDGIRTKLTVSEPGDAMEQEADQVAKSVISTEHQQSQDKFQRQPEALPEDEKKKEGMPPLG